MISLKNKEIQKEVCWTLSNIAAGSSDEIDLVFDLDIVPTLIELVKAPDTDPEVRGEICWFILNATRYTYIYIYIYIYGTYYSLYIHIALFYMYVCMLFIIYNFLFVILIIIYIFSHIKLWFQSTN